MKCQECTDNESRKTKKNEILHPAYRLGQRKMIFWKIRLKIEAGPGPGRAGPKKQKKTKINQKRHKSQNGAFSFATLMLSLCLRTGPLACFAPRQGPGPPPRGAKTESFPFLFLLLLFSFSLLLFFSFFSFPPLFFLGPSGQRAAPAPAFLEAFPAKVLSGKRQASPALKIRSACGLERWASSAQVCHCVI